MRKDAIADAALKQAYQMYEFSERGFHGTGIDADDVPVLAPQVSKLKKEDEPWEPNSAFYGNKPVGGGPASFNYGEEQGTGEFNAMESELTKLMSVQENLSGRLRRARQLGNFQEEHRIVKERNDVMKAISAVEAKMMVLDNGRFRRGMNDGLMYESQNHQDESNPFESEDEEENFSEFVSMIDNNDREIARLEAALLSYAEGKNLKSTGGDAAADPGQSYSPGDDEEDEEEEGDEESLDEE
jgi:hypothetical protein